MTYEEALKALVDQMEWTYKLRGGFDDEICDVRELVAYATDMLESEPIDLIEYVNDGLQQDAIEMFNMGGY